MIFRTVGKMVLLVGLSAGGAAAQQADGPAFKRLSAPKPGQAPKIDVQIDPDAYFEYFNPPPIAPADEAAPEDGANETTDPPTAKPFAAFWDVLERARAPGLPIATDALEDALAAGAIPAPRLQALQEIAGTYGKDILLASIGTRVSPAFALAVISVESAGQVDAISSAGATGLMQLMPATAERFGVENIADPKENIQGGITYLNWLIEEFEADPVFVLAGYNAGENAVKRNGGVPPFDETLGYVPKVLAAWQVARGLCMTPPELITDGCVFRTTKEAS